MHKYLYIAAGGAAGSLCRYLASGVVQKMVDSSFPAGTFAVNMIGCLLFGLVNGIFEDRLGFPPEMRLLILTGFMGAFTTFSTYMFESASLVKSGQWAMTAMNIGGQSILGFFCIIGGLALGRLIVS